MSRGKFITLEGGEGAGKSTQARLLGAALVRIGKECVLVREPGGTHLAELLRRLLKDEKEDPPCARAELLMFLAARAQLVKNVIVPALERGAWVISDRFSDSTFAYQGYGRGLDLDAIRVANTFACAGLEPDLTLLMELAPEVSVARRLAREAATNVAADRFEREEIQFHERLKAGFEALADMFPERIKRIDAAGTVEEVSDRIWKEVSHIL